jgi:predicted helicase
VYSIPDFFRLEDKARFLRDSKTYKNVQFTRCDADENGSWLTEGLQPEFSSFVPLGRRKKGSTEGLSIFGTYTNGVKTNRDGWMYGESRKSLQGKVELSIRTFNAHVRRWRLESARGKEIEEVFDYDSRKISWSRDLKNAVAKLREIEFRDSAIRPAMYRPFCRRLLYFDAILNEEIYSLKSVFPAGVEDENVAICCSAVANNKPFHCLAVNITPDVHLTGDSQCFPFYIFNENGKRQENISDAILHKFQAHYQDTAITKWDIFHFAYAVLHHPFYRERYAVNLKRELPRIPLAPRFYDFASAGKKLKDLHINYEHLKKFPLKRIERKTAKFDLSIERMRLDSDGSTLIYNKFLSLSGVPQDAFNYKLGTTSALEWVIEQFQFSRDPRSEIIRNPNEGGEPGYLIGLIEKVITLSIETNALVSALPDLGIKEQRKAVAAASGDKAALRTTRRIN